MIRHLYVLIALALIAVPARPQETSSIGFSKSNLVKSTFSAGRVAVEIFADGRVDVKSLVADLDLSKSASAQAISDSVNERRKLLYPTEEIILSIAPPSHAASFEEKVGLVKAIYWWNNANCSTCYWYAQYTSTVATMFIDAVDYGAYNIYDKVGSGNWIFRYLTSAGGSSTRYSFGPSTTRGFKGVAAGVDSQADIVMYFFK
jgi:hypothetical protein